MFLLPILQYSILTMLQVFSCIPELRILKRYMTNIPVRLLNYDGK